MTDFERRLRAAMAASAEPPPAGLMDGIRRKHRRYVRRTVAAAAAAVAVVATAGGLAVIRETPASPAATNPAAGPLPIAALPFVPADGPASTPRAHGTVLRDCQNNNNGTVGSNWKAHSVHAGPVWFIYARPKSTPVPGQRLATGKVTASAMVIAVDTGRTAVVTVLPTARGRFAFLYGFNSSGIYTLREGSASLTVTGCPPDPVVAAGIPAGDAQGLTLFWQGFVTDLRGCIPLLVRTPPARTSVRVIVAQSDGKCPS